MNTDTQTGPITLADVRATLADTDPSRTNASALRAILGRGSFATIQKHLDAIRAERAPVLPGALAVVPAAPKEALEALWTAAWGAAQSMTLGRLESLSAQRDAAQALAAAQAQDVTALAADVDMLTDKLATVTEQATLAAAAAANAQAQAQAMTAAQAAELSKARAEIDRVTQAAAHAAELAMRDAQIKEQMMQSAMNHLIDQVAELKSLLRMVKK